MLIIWSQVCQENRPLDTTVDLVLTSGVCDYTALAGLICQHKQFFKSQSIMVRYI